MDEIEREDSDDEFEVLDEYGNVSVHKGAPKQEKTGRDTITDSRYTEIGRCRQLRYQMTEDGAVILLFEFTPLLLGMSTAGQD